MTDQEQEFQPKQPEQATPTPEPVQSSPADAAPDTPSEPVQQPADQSPSQEEQPERQQRSDRRDRFQRNRRPQEHRERRGERAGETQGESDDARADEPQGERQGDQQGERQNERQGDRRGDRRGERRGDRRGDRQGDRQSDGQGERQGDRQGERQGERQSERQPERLGDRRNERQGGRQERQQDRSRDRDRQGERQGDRQGESREMRESGGKELSIVIPLYNEEQSLRELYDDIRSALSRINRYEVIFVDDGSTDGSFRILQGLRERDKGRIKLIRFRRNYGKSAALAAGFSLAQGSIVVTMDADLQDDPGEIPSLMNEVKKGFDLVSGWKKKRRDPITKTIPSRFFNFITSLMTGIKIHDFNCGLKAYRKEVVKEVRVYGELHRYIPVLAHWLGFRVGEVVVRHRPRKFGKTKYGMGRFWKGFLDLLTVLFTTRYMQRPLHLFGFWGLFFFLVGVAIDGYLVYLKIYEGASLSNRPLFVGGILFVIVGIQFISVGLLGEMISKTRNAGEDQYSIRESWK